MTSSRHGCLSAIQVEFLDAFFDLTQDYFLTGGGALVGFYGLMRATDDLDLFTSDRLAFDAADGLVRAAAGSLGAQVQVARAYPSFRRYHLARQDEALMLDVVHETVAQACDKAEAGKLRMDRPEEILANKLCALVGRAEVRDLWDTYHLLHRGLPFESALTMAQHKDSGVDAASLVFVLSQVNWDAAERLALKGGLTQWTEVAAFFRDLCERLALGLLPDEAK